MHQLLLAILLLGTALGSAIAEGQSTVTGVILGPNGEPVPTAQVEAFPIDNNGFVGSLTWASADEHGNFRLTLPEGRYEIRAKDEPEGFPDPNVLLSVDPHALFPEINVSKQHISGVTVRLGLKGGILEGAVRDKASGGALQKATITISDAGRPEAFVEVLSDKAGHFEFTVPSKPLLISVTARGYKGTRFAQGEPLLLTGGERRVIGFELERR